MTVKVQAELTARDNLSPALSKVEREIQKFGASIESNTRGIRKLENGFENMAVKSLGLQGNIGMLADSLIEFAPGGFVGIAVLGGIAAIVTHFQTIKTEAENAKKEVINLQIEFLRLSGDIVGAEFRAATEKAKLQFKEEDRLNALKGRVEGLGAAYQGLAGQTGVASLLVGAALVYQSDKLRDAENGIGQLRQETMNASKVYTNAIDAERKKTEDAIKQRQKEAASRKTEIDLLIEVSKLRSLTIGEVNTLISAEGTMLSQLNSKNVSYETQIKLLTKLNAAQGAYVANLLKPLPPTPADTQAPARDRSFEVKPMSVSPIIEKKIADATAAQSKREAETADKLTQDRMAKFEPYANAATDALSAMSEALANGENAFTAFGRSAAASISGILKALAKQNIVEGLSALGKAFFAASNPATAGSAPGFFSAAGYHFAAAAAAGVGAGVAAAGASGGGARGGGVGGAGGVNNSNLGRSSTAGQGTVTINITGGGILDMNNIDTQRSFVRALESVTNKRAVILGV
jgi:hypothetical protein